jgi:hypothetical protein
MTDPLSRIATRFAYGATQLPRVAWYVGHGLAMRRLAKAARPQHGKAARQRAQEPREHLGRARGTPVCAAAAIGRTNIPPPQ